MKEAKILFSIFAVLICAIGLQQIQRACKEGDPVEAHARRAGMTSELRVKARHSFYLL
jgi:hypothetical protein